MSDFVLAVDLGGTNMRMAAVDRNGRLLSHSKESTPRGMKPEELVELASGMGDTCRKSLDPSAKLVGVGFAVPAPAAKDFDGVLTKLPNLPTLTGMNLKAALEPVFNVPITVENDATAAAIGEDWLGATRDVGNSICVTLGTGIGGGIILNNEPLRGPDGTGGEIGHICVEPEGHPCGCGSNGCVEQYASATAIVRLAHEAGMEIKSSHDVFDAFKNGDERSIKVFKTAGRYLGIMLGGLVNAIAPDRIVVCGGVTAAWEAFAPHTVAEIAYRAYEAPARRAKLVPGELGDDAGILGAARSALAATG
jgi:glucokinase